jgi:hypothetical protein
MSAGDDLGRRATWDMAVNLVEGVGLRVYGLEFMVCGLWFRDKGLGFTVYGIWFRV